MSNERFTICKECKHLLEDGNTVWDHYCKASPIPLWKDPYDGEMKSQYNHLAFKHCHQVNKNGDCPKFKQLELK